MSDPRDLSAFERPVCKCDVGSGTCKRFDVVEGGFGTLDVEKEVGKRR